MAESPRITVVSEALRHAQDRNFEEAGDVLRHEGLKKGVEHALYLGGRSSIGRAALSRLAGEPIDDPRLRTYVSELELDGPVGIAPGWDKTGKTIHGWQAAGARHHAVGGITFFPQAGNRMPRLRTMESALGDHGVDVSLNCFGFWCPGSDKVLYNIQRQKELGEITIPIIPQITINKEFYDGANLDFIGDMVRRTIKKLLPIADAINLGLSSPNTVGMRDTQNSGLEFMSQIIYRAREVTLQSDKYIPIIYKGDGDGGEERAEQYCHWAEVSGDRFDAFELINTTALPHIKARYGAENMPGGLAGADSEYQQMALDTVRYIYQAVGSRFDIIGTGGVNSPEQALKMLEAGASAIGVNTGIRRHGIGTVRFLESGLLKLIDQKYPDATSLDQIIGAGTSRGPKVLTRESVSDKFRLQAERVGKGTYKERM